jgi:hypothetical protein
MRSTAEFSALLERVRHDALDPNNRQRVREFDLSHRDALKAEPRSAAQVGQE